MSPTMKWLYEIVEQHFPKYSLMLFQGQINSLLRIKNELSSAYLNTIKIPGFNFSSKFVYTKFRLSPSHFKRMFPNFYLLDWIHYCYNTIDTLSSPEYFSDVSQILSYRVDPRISETCTRMQNNCAEIFTVSHQTFTIYLSLKEIW